MANEGIRELIGTLLTKAALINIAEAVNKGREESFETIKDQIGAFMYSAILDEKTCQICEELDATYYEPDDPKLKEIEPPLHSNCRCVFVVVLKEETENYPVKFTYLTTSQVEQYTVNKLW